MKFIEDKFKSFVAAAYGPKLDPKSSQYSDLKDAFFGGALVLFIQLHIVSSALTEENAMKVLSAIQRELDEHQLHARSAADLYESLIKAAEKEAGHEPADPTAR